MEAIRAARAAKYQQHRQATGDVKSTSAEPASSSTGSSGAAPAAANGGAAPPQPAAESTPSAVSRAPATEAGLKPLVRIQILPLEGTSSNEPPLVVLGPQLRGVKDRGEAVTQGRVFKHGSEVYVVVRCDPPEGGYVTSETDLFFEGNPVVRFAKIQFTGLAADIETTSEDVLFSEFVGPYCQSQIARTDDYLPVTCEREQHDIFGTQFVVAATDPQGVGIIDKDTLLYVEVDETPEFDRIHVLPFQDTLPRVYDYDLFGDYLKPFFKQNVARRYAVNDQFTWQGVQFKVVCVDPPDRVGRVGRNTTVFCDGVLHPSLRNLLPPHLVEQLSRLPPGLQMLLLNTDQLGNGDVYERLMEVQERLNNRRGLSQQTIDQIQSFKWSEEKKVECGQETCMICLCEFEMEEECRKLPCTHVFHGNCVDEWLRRCTDCPICKANIDRTIRNY